VEKKKTQHRMAEKIQVFLDVVLEKYENMIFEQALAVFEKVLTPYL